jgi:GxxExxY protein
MEKTHDKPALLHGEITGRILKVFFDVYNELGYGFREFVYLRAMRIALTAAGLQVQQGVEWPVWFRGDRIASFQPDLVIGDGPVLIELKAKSVLEPHDVAQALSYLKASDIEVALLLNFGKRPDYMRRVFENGNKRNRSSTGPVEIFPDTR